MGQVMVAFYCTLDFILGKMGWKHGDHLEGYIQGSYDGGRSGEKELDCGSVLTDRTSSSVMGSFSQTLSLLLIGCDSLWQPREAENILGHHCCPGPGLFPQGGVQPSP